jgi:LmbE family N-acetylglucosaminyl deacetylase
MTDGSKSHRRYISEQELRAIRASEGLAASQSLGLNACDVFFLDFEETKLGKHVDSATDRVKEILLQQKPEEIFIPYRRDPNSDHLATNRIVLSALQAYTRKVIIYEYPIWFWHQWPWTNPLGAIRIGGPRRILINSLVSGLGLRFLKDFRCSIYIGDVLELKRAALVQHKSQMTRLIPDPRWKTLSDVSNGEFLACFFREREIFRCYTFLSRATRTA